LTEGRVGEEVEGEAGALVGMTRRKLEGMRRISKHKLTLALNIGRSLR
jgi:hypothetical protein